MIVIIIIILFLIVILIVITIIFITTINMSSSIIGIQHVGSCGFRDLRQLFSCWWLITERINLEALAGSRFDWVLFSKCVAARQCYCNHGGGYFSSFSSE